MMRSTSALNSTHLRPLVVPAGQGSLLDNMGQLAAYWVMEQPTDCLAMPIGVDRIRFLSAAPAVPCIATEGWRTRRY